MMLSNYYPVLADTKDQQDLIYRPMSQTLREQVDMRPWASAVENQASLRSCTSMAVVGAYELMLKKFYPEKFVDLSALFVYYNARILEGARLTDDTGVYIKDALKSVKQQGICADAVWPYNAKNVSCVPTLESYEDAKTRTIKNYYRCDNFDSMLAALSNDIPVVVSMKIYSNFNTFGWQGQSHLTMPDNKEIVGGHSVVIVGYNNGLQHLIARNSFGATWADQGYFYIPYDYARENIMDAWVFDIAVE